MNKIYIKQSKHHNISHVYEHILMKKFETEALRKGFFRGVDYERSAEVIDGITIVSIDTKSKKILGIFENLLHELEISNTNVTKAVKEISCEYNRPYECNVELLHKEINNLNKEKWLEYKNLNITSPIEKSGWSLKMPPVLSFKKVNKTDYETFSFIYNFEKIDPTLKPLAMYVAQFLALVQIDYFYSRAPEIDACYDRGDTWAEWQFEYNRDIVGYAHYLTLFKDHKLTTFKMRKIFDRNYQEILSKNFCKKLLSFLKSEANHDYRYFRSREIIKDSGFLVGKKWFKENCNVKNIDHLLKIMKVTIVKEK